MCVSGTLFSFVWKVRFVDDHALSAKGELKHFLAQERETHLVMGWEVNACRPEAEFKLNLGNVSDVEGNIHLTVGIDCGEVDDVQFDGVQLDERQLLNLNIVESHVQTTHEAELNRKHWITANIKIAHI